MVKKIFIFILVILLFNISFISSDSYISSSTLIKRGPTYDLYKQSDGSFKKIQYPHVVNIKDINNEYKPFNEVVNVSWKNGRIVYKWNNKKLVLEPFIIYNGHKISLPTIRGYYPNIKANSFIKKHRGNYKWSINLTNIPDVIKNNIDYIIFEFVSSENITWDDLSKDKNNVYLPDNLKLSYKDIVDSGFTINLINKTYLVIGNVSGKNNLWLDPTISYNYSDENDIIAKIGGGDGLASTCSQPYPNILYNNSCIDTDETSNTDLDSSDDNRLRNYGSDYAVQLFEAKVSENIEDITLLNWTYEGKTNGATKGFAIGLWDWSISEWKQCGNNITDFSNDEIRNCEETSDISNYINSSGYTYLIASEHDSSQDIQTDYVKLEITYDDLVINNPSSNEYILNKLTTILNVSTSGYNNTVWYSWNNGVINNTLCSSDIECLENQTTITFPRQGYYNLTVWANKSDGIVKNKSINNLFVGNKSFFDSTSGLNIWGFAEYVEPNDVPPPDEGPIYTSASNKSSETEFFSDDGDRYVISNDGYGLFNPFAYNNINQKLNKISWYYDILATYDEATHSPFYMYFYNYNTQSWDEMDSKTNNYNGYWNINTSLSDYINSTDNQVSSIIHSGDNSYFDLEIDYVYLELFTLNYNEGPLINQIFENNSLIDVNNINLTYNITDDNDYVINATLWLDGKENKTTIYPLLNTKQNFSVILSDGIHNWSITVCDSDSNCSNSTIRYFTIDTTTPNINITFPLNNTNTSNNQLNVNYTFYDANIELCWWGNETTNTSITCGENITNVIWSEGKHNITIYINDTLNHVNSSFVSFFVDTIPPTLTIDQPVEYQSFNFNNDIQFNYTLSDLGIGLDSCWYANHTDNNITFQCSDNNFTISQIGDGDFHAVMWANDSLNNIIKVNRTYSISATSPSITLNYPLNNMWINNNIIDLNLTALDNDGLDNCTLYGNWSGGWHQNFTNQTAIYSGVEYNTTLIIDEGFYKYNYKCFDTANNYGWGSINFSFGIDTTYPDILLENITTSEGSQTFTFDINATDINSLNCWYSVFNSSGEIDPATNENTSVNCNGKDISETVSKYGDYELIVYVNDSANNINKSSKTLTIEEGSSGSGGSGGESKTETVFVGNATWDMTTEQGSNFYEIPMVAFATNERELFFKNNGAEIIFLNLKCEGEICQYISLDKNNLSLPVGTDIMTSVSMKIKIPRDAVNKLYQGNIIATDQYDNKDIITLKINVGGIGYLFYFFDKLFTESKRVNGVPIPYLMIFLFTVFFSFILFYYIGLKKIPAGLGITVIISLIFGIISIILT